MKTFKKIILLYIITLIIPAVAFSKGPPYLLKILKKELDYNFKLLKKEEIKPYYIVYRAEDKYISYYRYRDGYLLNKIDNKKRQYDVDIRVGSPEIDNSHYIRKGMTAEKNLFRLAGMVPMGENDKGIRQSIWLTTHEAYRRAVETYKKVIENIKTRSEEEDKAPDFLLQPPQKVYIPAEKMTVDFDSIRSSVQECSRLFINNPNIINNVISLQYIHRVKYLVDTEGTEYAYPVNLFSIIIQIYGQAKNGMMVFRTRSLYFKDSKKIYSKAKLLNICKALIGELDKLMVAESGDPYSGPAIFSGEAAAVFFHEIFGHRMEGHRQRDETFGQTFTKKIGKKVFPDFITIVDDPTKKSFNDTLLNGYYPIDDEGVISQPAVLVDKGILKTFLMSRKGVQDFRESNGHGRGVIGRQPVSRMGNTIVTSEKRHSFKELREKLIQICKDRGLPYGYYFKDIRGGFTSTGRRGPQTFKIIPVLVYKIYTDGRPDTLVNGIDIVGTPLASMSKIITTSSNYQIFNGHCGAESGSIPVSAVAPDLLVEEIEIEKKQKSFDTEPILPPIKLKDVKNEGITVAMQDEMKRNMKELKLEDSAPPFFIAFKKIHSHNFQLQYEYGDIISSFNFDDATLYADVKLGDYQTSSDYFYGRSRQSSRISKTTVINDDYFTTRKHLWRFTDSLYKNLVEKFTVKKDYLVNNPMAKLYPDFSEERKTVHIEKKPITYFNIKNWEAILPEISRVSLEYKDIDNVSFTLRSVRDNSTYINSEGSKVITFPQVTYLTIEYEGQRDDLTEIRWADRIRIPSDRDTSFLKKKLPEIKASHTLFQGLLHCDAMEDYSGPVIMEGESAADFLIRKFLSKLIKGGAPVLQIDREEQRNTFIKYKGRKILPSFLSIIDDPTVSNFNGQPLIGHYKIDQQGVPGQRVEIIKNGKLINAIYSRRPGKFQNMSTGHGQRNKGMGDVFPDFSNLFIESKETKSKDQLKELLREKCRENELPYGIIVRQITSAGKILEAYKVDVQNGKETLVYGGNFENFNIKSFKDIVATSREKTVREYFSSRYPEKSQSIIIPDFLIDDIDIRYTPGKKPKKPAGIPPLKR